MAWRWPRRRIVGEGRPQDVGEERVARYPEVWPAGERCFGRADGGPVTAPRRVPVGCADDELSGRSRRSRAVSILPVLDRGPSSTARNEQVLFRALSRGLMPEDLADQRDEVSLAHAAGPRRAEVDRVEKSLVGGGQHSAEWG